MSDRVRRLNPLLLAASLAAFLPALGAAQGFAPHRKPGMWETTMAVAGRPITTGFCTDAALENRLSMLNPQQMGARSCTGMTPQPTPGGFRMEGTCTNGGRTSHVVATVKGDLNSAYSMDVATDVDGKALTPMHMDAKWTGPCEAGLKPGDMTMTMPNGKHMVMNMSAVAAAGAGGPGAGPR